MCFNLGELEFSYACWVQWLIGAKRWADFWELWANFEDFGDGFKNFKGQPDLSGDMCCFFFENSTITMSERRFEYWISLLETLRGVSQLSYKVLGNLRRDMLFLG